MVLQQGLENKVWGWAESGESVTVELNGKRVSVKAGESGKWQVKLPAMDYGGPYTMTISGENKVVFENVMIGEVWICSGQSNMGWTVDRSNNAEEEIANANYPNIRLFTVPRKVAQTPKDDLDGGEWMTCSPETIGSFSAVAYFFGRKLHRDLNVAIGLVNDSWGGTVAETWISSETIEKDEDFRDKWQELQGIDFDNYAEVKKNEIAKIFGGFPEKDKGEELGYIRSNYNDSQWATLTAPGPWEAKYPNIDGVGWYRQTIELSREQSEEEGLLYLSRIDDMDVCWVNGVEVGRTNSYSDYRRYVLPSSLLVEGVNTIVVRVLDTGGGGGLVGDGDEFYLKLKDEKIMLAKEWKFKITEVNTRSFKVQPNTYPTLLFNAMINPIVGYGMKGVIWYQGESNASRAKQYQRIFPDLIKDWRNHWGQGDFPFLYVQLANFQKPVNTPSESSWAELREAQTMTLKLPNTGMASAIDIGEAGDIHPRNKQDVGMRLALAGLKVAYKKDLVYSGPMYKSMKVKGDKVIVTFNQTGSGLEVRNKYGYVNGFSIAGTDGRYHWAKAYVDGDKVIVFSPNVTHPINVRYGWADNPDDLNLYNKEGLPANPFRSDQ
ncbi:sialate O-acetylesterase [Membranihabitans marinus]